MGKAKTGSFISVMWPGEILSLLSASVSSSVRWADARLERGRGDDVDIKAWLMLCAPQLVAPFHLSLRS